MKIVPPQTLFTDRGPQAIILLHSYTGSPNDFRSLMRGLAQADYSVYAPLFTGHGTNNPTDVLTKGNVQAWWQDTQQAINFVQQHNKHLLAIFGLSLGSIFALKALENYPQIDLGGVFGSPMFASDMTNVRAGFFQYAQKIEQHQDLGFGQQAQQQRVIEQLLNPALNSISQTTLEVRQQLSQIKQPLFIGHGSNDEIINNISSKLLREHVQTTVDFHLYPNAGHVITVNKARPQLEQDLLQFLSKNRSITN